MLIYLHMQNSLAVMFQIKQTACRVNPFHIYVTVYTCIRVCTL